MMLRTLKHIRPQYLQLPIAVRACTTSKVASFHTVGSSCAPDGSSPNTHVSDSSIPPEAPKIQASKFQNSKFKKHKPWRKNNAYSGPVVSLYLGPRFGYGHYLPFWLRENCQCSECVHPETKQRMVDTFSIPPDVQAKRVTHIDIQQPSLSGELRVQWSDGHQGIYSLYWLRHHRRPSYQDLSDLTLTFRPSDIFAAKQGEVLPTVHYDEVMSTDEALLLWLDKIYRHGYSFVKGVPVDPESTKRLIERIAFIRHTHYGGFWDFTADLTYKDTAYTNEPIGPHTDNTYFTDPARLQLFHLLSHTDGEGGQNLLIDGFKIASDIMRFMPRHLRALAEYPQPFHSSGNEDVSIQPLFQAPVLNVRKEDKQLYQVRWNNYDRAAKTDWNHEHMKKWYAAAHYWKKMMDRPNSQLWTQLEPGTALIFDNWRMLHARTQFTGKRRMCGGYVNNDDFLSRYRLLKFGRERVLHDIGNSYLGPSNASSLI